MELLPGVCGVESQTALVAPPPASLFILLSRGLAAAQVAAVSTVVNQHQQPEYRFCSNIQFLILQISLILCILSGY